MAEILVFHHAQGLTAGCLAFADELRAGGHVVHAPDLYDGKTFSAFEAGVGHAQELGFDTILESGRRIADALPNDLVYIGISLGVLPAQMLAQTRAGAKAAVLVSACIPPSEFGGAWPHGVPVQIQLMEADPIVVGDGDLDAARQLADSTDDAELFLYPGDRHLFVDSSLLDYDEDAAGEVTRRVLSFLERL